MPIIVPPRYNPWQAFATNMVNEFRQRKLMEDAMAKESGATLSGAGATGGAASGAALGTAIMPGLGTLIGAGVGAAGGAVAGPKRIHPGKGPNAKPGNIDQWNQQLFQGLTGLAAAGANTIGQYQQAQSMANMMTAPNIQQAGGLPPGLDRFSGGLEFLPQATGTTELNNLQQGFIRAMDAVGQAAGTLPPGMSTIDMLHGFQRQTRPLPGSSGPEAGMSVPRELFDDQAFAAQKAQSTPSLAKTPFWSPDAPQTSPMPSAASMGPYSGGRAFSGPNVPISGPYALYDASVPPSGMFASKEDALAWMKQFPTPDSAFKVWAGVNQARADRDQKIGLQQLQQGNAIDLANYKSNLDFAKTLFDHKLAQQEYELKTFGQTSGRYVDLKQPDAWDYIASQEPDAAEELLIRSIAHMPESDRVDYREKFADQYATAAQQAQMTQQQLHQQQLDPGAQLASIQQMENKWALEHGYTWQTTPRDELKLRQLFEASKSAWRKALNNEDGWTAARAMDFDRRIAPTLHTYMRGTLVKVPELKNLAYMAKNGFVETVSAANGSQIIRTLNPDGSIHHHNVQQPKEPDLISSNDQLIIELQLLQSGATLTPQQKAERRIQLLQEAIDTKLRIRQYQQQRLRDLETGAQPARTQAPPAPAGVLSPKLGAGAATIPASPGELAGQQPAGAVIPPSIPPAVQSPWRPYQPSSVTQSAGQISPQLMQITSNVPDEVSIKISQSLAPVQGLLKSQGLRGDSSTISIHNPRSWPQATKAAARPAATEIVEWYANHRTETMTYELRQFLEAILNE